MFGTVIGKVTMSTRTFLDGSLSLLKPSSRDEWMAIAYLIFDHERRLRSVRPACSWMGVTDGWGSGAAPRHAPHKSDISLLRHAAAVSLSKLS